MKVHKEQLIIIVVATILLGGFAVLRYIPLSGRTKAIKAARADYDIAQQKIREQARQLPLFNAEMERCVKLVGNYDERIPVDRRFAMLCNEIADVMNKCNLSDQLIQPGKETAGKDINSIELYVECAGRLSKIFEFFKSIEQFERVIRVESIQMLSKQDSDVINVKADAIVYYRPKETADGVE